MSLAQAFIQPHGYVFLRPPNSQLKLIEIKPNTIIEIGKLGSFPSNLLIGRPYYYAYEILEKRDDEAYSRLRIVPAHEINAETITQDESASESRRSTTPAVESTVPEGFDLLDAKGRILVKNNRLTIDNASRQALSQQEIEELKQSHGGKEIIEKILANHSGLDEKTEFSRAKYTLRKTKKYIKRFTVLPMDVPRLVEYILDKEAARIMEIREEALGLLSAWSNAHFTTADTLRLTRGGKRVGGGRWLVVDETGGLIVAALAEKMGFLFPNRESDDRSAAHQEANGTTGELAHLASDPQHQRSDEDLPDEAAPGKPVQHRDFLPPSPTNSITVLHPAVQPNLSLLKYFGYDTNNPDSNHPLHTHLKPISLLQLLHSEEDPMYHEPQFESTDQLSTWKSAKRGAYHKKRRRWERLHSIVEETKEGGFDGLVVASHMTPESLLPHVIPLVRGGGTITMYHPTIEPLKRLADLYSKDRKVAYIAHLGKGEVPDNDDFPLDPRLLLAPTIQTTRIREWQVLPGRTHPMMSGRGGSEGYVFTAHKVVPLEGGVEARGNFGKKRRIANGEKTT